MRKNLTAVFGNGMILKYRYVIAICWYIFNLNRCPILFLKKKLKLENISLAGDSFFIFVY
jgi:hypothetical protein